MIIQHFDFAVRGRRPAGLRGRHVLRLLLAGRPWPTRSASATRRCTGPAATSWPRRPVRFPTEPPFPDADAADDRPHRPVRPRRRAARARARSRAERRSIPDAWFFKAHFHQDPVWPGSLGLESFLQLLKVVRRRALGRRRPTGWQSMAPGRAAPLDLPRPDAADRPADVTVQAYDHRRSTTRRRSLKADGFLGVDGRVIYQMTDFTLQGSTLSRATMQLLARLPRMRSATSCRPSSSPRPSWRPGWRRSTRPCACRRGSSRR